MSIEFAQPGDPLLLGRGVFQMPLCDQTHSPLSYSRQHNCHWVEEVARARLASGLILHTHRNQFIHSFIHSFMYII